MTRTTPAVMTMLALMGLGPAAVRAETTLCTVITSLPATISSPGVYCLESDFAYTSANVNAITIAANNVTLDLNAHKIGDLGAGTATGAVGVFAINQQNITIKNGTIRGFELGIFITDGTNPPATSQGHLIEDVRLDQNRYEAINVRGNGCIIRNNQVVATGGTTSFANPDGIGIIVQGAGNRVLDNDVSGTTSSGTGNAFGIESTGGDGLVVAGNRVSGVVAPTGLEYAINITVSPHATIRDNTLSNAAIPTTATQSVGLSMDDATDVFTGNVSIGFNTPYSGGTNATGTNF